MKRRRMLAFAAGTGMLILILDAKTAVAGASEGLRQCMEAVIPTLFPFFVLSNILTASVAGWQCPVLYPLGRALGIPRGGESLFLIGILGGYPVGAKCISQAYEKKTLSAEDAERMLGFCSNAGPAFLFGMGLELFDRLSVPVCLWGIHIASAMLTGFLLPGKRNAGPVRIGSGQVSPIRSVRQSISVLAMVCGWVILFRILLCFLSRWCLWLFPVSVRTGICGILELTNGFLELEKIPVPGFRFLLCSAFLGFGGLCVALQTYGVVNPEINMKFYIPGKIIQCSLSLVLAGLFQECLFPVSERTRFTPVFWAAPLFTIGLTLGFLRCRQNRSRKMLSVGV